MPDEMARTQEVCDRLLEDDLAEHFRRQRGTSPPVLGGAGGGTVCIDCDIEIPEKRRLAVPDCTRCVSCQGDYEIHDHWRAL
jgi:phage/conjugal plasmid C-4 type zinc finger TraR family protein